jgi:hypothetical protein
MEPLVHKEIKDQPVHKELLEQTEPTVVLVHRVFKELQELMELMVVLVRKVFKELQVQHHLLRVLQALLHRLLVHKVVKVQPVLRELLEQMEQTHLLLALQVLKEQQEPMEQMEQTHLLLALQVRKEQLEHQEPMELMERTHRLLALQVRKELQVLQHTMQVLLVVYLSIKLYMVIVIKGPPCLVIQIRLINHLVSFTWRRAQMEHALEIGNLVYTQWVPNGRLTMDSNFNMISIMTLSEYEE